MKKVCIITLGCKVNQYESDTLGEALEEMGFTVSHKLENADIFVLNSCAVTNEAERKSRQMIAKFNKLNPKCKIFVCGCASQNNAEQFISLPNVRYVIGNGNILSLIDNLSKKGKKITKHTDIYDTPGLTKPSLTRGYVKIQDGCNRYCSYCLIPYLRGPSRSRDIVSILKEIKTLIDGGVQEIVLTGVDISDYKIDGQNALLDLMKEINKFGVRFRLSSFEPNILTKEFVEEIKSLSNLCPHFHISMQSGSSSVLKRMNRHYTSEFFIERVKLLRKYFKNCAITTDIIVGFPGESEEEFEQTIDTVKKCKFSHIHVFPYSRRSGTACDKMIAKKDERFKMVDGKIAKARVSRLLEIGKKFEKTFLKKQLGKKLEVIIEEKKGEFFTSTSRNYVKVFIPANQNKNLTGIHIVKIKKLHLDGVIGQL
ncbi:MAG: tRNA (N(6)-L-threonylcarbamoyladenosine(37)-C(2))-methylthiotransferase MtaB [Clostridia bacterium]|nr:tRNA (N(6)-L-threonylcarbamoyladenosine(37)-C(2))-methylthiotransferase MtaB [Clostridia bacterium]